MCNSGGTQLLCAATSWTSASDRLLDIANTYENQLEDINQIKPLNSNGRMILIIKIVLLSAQSVQYVVPEAVDTILHDDDNEEYQGVRYTELIPLLIASGQARST